jgi:hypothetical protein
MFVLWTCSSSLAPSPVVWLRSNTKGRQTVTTTEKKLRQRDNRDARRLLSTVIVSPHILVTHLKTTGYF